MTEPEAYSRLLDYYRVFPFLDAKLHSGMLAFLHDLVDDLRRQGRHADADAWDYVRRYFFVRLSVNRN